MEGDMVMTRSLRSHSRIPLAEMSIENIVKRRRESPPSPPPPPATAGESSSEESSEDWGRENHPPTTSSSPHTPNRFYNSSWLSSPFWSQNTSYDQNNPWETAPNEVIVKIFSYLKMSDLFRVAQVCSNWRTLSHDILLWSRCNLSGQTIPLHNLLGILNNGVKYLSLAKANVPSEQKKAKQRRCCLSVEYADFGMCSVETNTLTKLLSCCTNLTKLNLEFLKLSPAALKAVSRCKHLKVLNLAMCEGIKVESLVSVTNKCRVLEQLNIAWSGITDDGLQRLFPEGSSSTLQQLNMSGARTVQTDTVIHLTQRLPNLTVLDISDCTELGLSVLTNLADNCTKLQHLSLSRVYGITMSDILVQLDHFPSLTQLDVCASKQFTEKMSELFPHIQLDKNPLSAIARPCNALRVGKGISVLWEKTIYS